MFYYKISDKSNPCISLHLFVFGHFLKELNTGNDVAWEMSI